ncbi:MAG: TolC family protein [Gammaproteobacteria bacterium]|nr:TolC family protein [Gammaproteobacteria bacterium]
MKPIIKLGRYSIQLVGTLVLLACSMVPIILFAEESSNQSVLAVEMAVAAAVQGNPGLAEMQYRYEAMAEIPSQVGTLPDPMLSLGAMNLPLDTFNRDQEAMTQMQIGFSQIFPFPGKLGLREEVAEFEAQAASFSVEEMRLKLTDQVVNKWWQVYYLDRAIDTIESNQLLLEQFIEIARTKYETGTGLQQDVLLAQLELSKLIDQEIQVTSLRRNQAIRLNVLMDRKPQSAILLPASVSNVMPAILAEDELHRLAEVARPLLKNLEQKLASANSRLDLAKRDYYPDFSVGVAYGNRAGRNAPFVGGSRSDLLSIMVGIKIPLYSGRKQSRAVSQRTSEVQRQQYGLLDERGRVMADISAAVTDYQRAQAQLSLFENGIVPQAGQTVQSMLAGYQVNEVDFLNLVRSQVTLFSYELQYWKALTEARQALSWLEASVGEESIYE